MNFPIGTKIVSLIKMNGENVNCIPSVVKFPPCESISDCTIDEYDFEWLVSTGDYKNAGRIMHNCLEYTDQQVVAIKLNGDYYAAIAIELYPRREITQA